MLLGRIIGLGGLESQLRVCFEPFDWLWPLSFDRLTEPHERLKPAPGGAVGSNGWVLSAVEVYRTSLRLEIRSVGWMIERVIQHSQLASSSSFLPFGCAGAGSGDAGCAES